MYQATKSNGEIITCYTVDQKRFFDAKYKGLKWGSDEPVIKPEANYELNTATVETPAEINTAVVDNYYENKKRGRPPKSSE